MKLSRALILLALFAAPSVVADTLYNVSVKLQHADTLIGSPTLEVYEGKPALVEVYGNENGYQLEVTVTGERDDEVIVAANFASAFGNIDPVLHMRESEPASVTLDNIKMRVVVERL